MGGVLSACGSGAHKSGAKPPVTTAAPTSPLAIVQGAIAATRAAGTARVAHRLVFDASAFGANTRSDGVANFTTHDAQWTNDMSSTPNGLVPAGTPPDQIRMQVRKAGPYLYTSLPPAFIAAGITQTWLRVPAVPPPGSTGFTGFEKVSARIPLIARFEAPEVAFAILATVSGAHQVGPASVRGKTTTEYAVDAKLRAMLEYVGLMFFFGNPTSAHDIAVIDQVCKQAATVDVFVDQLGRLREVLVDADLGVVAPHFSPPQSPSIWHTLRLEWDFYDFGTPATVVAPTASVLAVR
jgi:hypothetical protein